MSFDEKREFVYNIRTNKCNISNSIYTEITKTLRGKYGDSIIYVSSRSYSEEYADIYENQIEGFLSSINDKNLETGKLAAIGSFKTSAKSDDKISYNVELFVRDTLHFDITSFEIN